MEKGIIIIKKKPRHILSNGLTIPIKKEVPEIGKEYDKMECFFEGSPATLIRIGNLEFKADLEKQKARLEALNESIEHQKMYDIMLNRQKNNGDSFYLPKSILPRDTKEVILDGCDNFNLKFYKLARFDYKDSSANDRRFSFYNAKDIARGKGQDRETIVPSFIIKHNDYGLGNKINFLATQHLKTAQLLFIDEECLKSENFTPDWRFVIGLGTDSVYETGITLHHIYGFPYIPSSGIKGITRSHIIGETFNNKEEDAFKNKEFCDIFGCTSKSYYKEARKGKITFFDAMPTEVPQLKPDIMNVHYPDYYNGTQSPTDTQNPNPIFFLTVESTPFQFMLGGKTEDKSLLNSAFNWLKEALEFKGIGAKTAVGYGYFSTNN